MAVLDPILLFSLALLGSAGAACPNVPGWIPLQGSCYMTSPSPLTWFQAQEFCNTKGGYLAEITSAKESDLVSSVLSQDLEFWIGLNDLANSGHYVWQHSFTQMSWSNWASGQPDHFNGKEHCVEMWMELNNGWKWNDFECEKNDHQNGSFDDMIHLHALCES